MKLEDHEMSLLERREEQKLQKRHAWKVWVVAIGIFLISAAIMATVNPYVGIASFFLLLYASKNFDPAR